LVRRSKIQLELAFGEAATGEARSGLGEGTEASAANADVQSPAAFAEPCMEAIVERDNLRKALAQVKRNKGAPGLDGMTVEALGAHLKDHWLTIRAQLLDGSYKPQPVKRVEIPKAAGGVRALGVPTVLDRFVQQAVMQVLQAAWDGTFSASSYGFRPKRSAHQAVRAAQEFIASGRRVVVDIDIEKFFDRVNHDILMGLVAKRVADARILRLIRGFLTCGVLADGLVGPTDEGTPQGGPLSPLLSNLMLDELDKELERRGHCFARYADDCNVYVRSRRAGERVMTLLRRLYAGLHLTVNEAKSAVASVVGRKFLGYSLWVGPKGEIKRRVADKPMATFKQRIRQLTRRSGGRSMAEVVERLRPFVLGWRVYFGLSQTPKVWRTLDEWLRHRLRAVQLKHWKRGTTMWRELKALGASDAVARRVAANSRRWWRNSDGLLKTVLTIAYFDRLGVPRLA